MYKCSICGTYSNRLIDMLDGVYHCTACNMAYNADQERELHPAGTRERIAALEWEIARVRKAEEETVKDLNWTRKVLEQARDRAHEESVKAERELAAARGELDALRDAYGRLLAAIEVDLNASDRPIDALHLYGPDSAYFKSTITEARRLVRVDVG